MAETAVIPKPGSKQKGAPCRTVCLHEDCEAGRSIAATACSVCGGGIGYETQYVAEVEDVGDGFDRYTYSHAVCAAAKADNFAPPFTP